MTLTSYHDLIVWQKAIDLVVDCYRLTGKFPRTELYGLMSLSQPFRLDRFWLRTQGVAAARPGLGTLSPLD